MTESEELNYLRHMVKEQELQLQGHVERYQGFIDEVTRGDKARCATIAKLLQEKKDAETDWLSLEKQYAERLGEIARLCDIVCLWVLDYKKCTTFRPIEVLEAAEEIMEYVDVVRPANGHKCTSCGGNVTLPGKCEPCSVGEA